MQPKQIIQLRSLAAIHQIRPRGSRFSIPREKDENQPLNSISSNDLMMGKTLTPVFEAKDESPLLDNNPSWDPKITDDLGSRIKDEMSKFNNSSCNISGTGDTSPIKPNGESSPPCGNQSNASNMIETQAKEKRPSPSSDSLDAPEMKYASATKAKGDKSTPESNNLPDAPETSHVLVPNVRNEYVNKKAHMV